MALKIAWEIGMAIIMGAALGYLAGRALQWAEQEDAIEPPVFLSFTVALSLLVLGVTALLHADDILSVFVAGVVLSLIISAHDRAREARLQEAINQIFIVPVFLFLGAALPFDDWLALGWPALLLILAIMLFRRVPALLLAGPLIPATSGPVDSLFVGWFGTVGVAAVYWAALAWHHTDEDLVWTIGTLVVVGSIFVHGMSAAWLTCRYKEATGFQGAAESEEGDEDPQYDVE